MTKTVPSIIYTVPADAHPLIAGKTLSLALGEDGCGHCYVGRQPIKVILANKPELADQVKAARDVDKANKAELDAIRRRQANFANLYNEGADGYNPHAA